MINYIIVNAEGTDKIDEFKVLDRIESGHMQVCCKLSERLVKKKQEQEEARDVTKGDNS